MDIQGKLDTILTILDELRSDVSSCNSRLDNLESTLTDIKSTSDNHESLMINLSKTIADNTNMLDSFKTNLSTLEANQASMQVEISDNKNRLTTIEDKYDSFDEKLYNSSHNNNVLLFNIPKTTALNGPVINYLKTELNVKIDPHKISNMRRLGSKDNANPNPILLSLTSEAAAKEVLNNISAALRKPPYKDLVGTKIAISDDIHESTRDVHTELVKTAKEFRRKEYSAFIPFTTPRVIKYKKKGSKEKYIDYIPGDKLPF